MALANPTGDQTDDNESTVRGCNGTAETRRCANIMKQPNICNAYLRRVHTNRLRNLREMCGVLMPVDRRLGRGR